ncbi:MptD family putative ECF transporter S component [Treponema pedis]|uniref:Trep_Strep domain-containing protein n=1 Tax=Treponema pedis str. T A4 TaxID=1291379 RepID=S5ZK49_9SPIR|nr:MptD family putative ECF transporter S component [Treponema pedis]AGT42947.1 hypothetical protein TPE_0451 [Treponema pedis str. T A4]QSI03803.1 Trep_Strep domain-containing protein [Treponema pedis]
MNNNLELKDVVNTAIFAVVYFVGVFIIGMPFGTAVITLAAAPFVVSLFLGVVVLFFMEKVQKPLSLFIFAVIPGSLSALMGGSWLLIAHSFIVAGFAELVRSLIGYKTVKGGIAGYAVMSMWLAGSFWQIFIMKEQYYILTEKNMGADYAAQLVNLPLWIMPVLYVISFAGGILGGLLGVKLLKRYFTKEGFV